MSFFSKSGSGFTAGQVSQFATPDGKAPDGWKRASGILRAEASFYQGRCHVLPYAAGTTGVSVASITDSLRAVAKNKIACIARSTQAFSSLVIDLGTLQATSVASLIVSNNYTPRGVVACGNRIHNFASRDTVSNGAPSFTHQAINVDTGLRETLASNSPFSLEAAVGLPDGKTIITAGGVTGGTGNTSGTAVNTVRRYNYDTNEWVTYATPAPVVSSLSTNFGIALSNQEVLWLYAGNWYLMDVATGAWLQVDTAPTTPVTSGLLPDGRPFIIASTGRAFVFTKTNAPGAQWSEMPWVRGDGVLTVGMTRQFNQTDSGLVVGWNSTVGFFTLFDTNETPLANIAETFYAIKE